jgi:AcrR family transcriptional regulator
MKPLKTPTSDTTAPRTPVQQRSRERRERILDIAQSLIQERGSDVLRMSEVSEKAGTSIGSLYQYFPDKTALIAGLAERFNTVGRTCTANALATVKVDADLAPALRRITDEFYAMYLEEPVMRDIWAATQVDRTLQTLDEADGMAHTAMLEDVLARLRPQSDPAKRQTVALLTMQLLASTVRLTITLDHQQAQAILESFKRWFLANPLEALGKPVKSIRSKS